MFSWDMRTCTWTDGRGDEEPYASDVRPWCKSHDALPANNSNLVPPDRRGMTLNAYLYDSAADLCHSIPHDIIGSVEGVDAIIDALY